MSDDFDMALLVNGELIDNVAIREESNLIRDRLKQEFPEEGDLELDVRAREWAIDNIIEQVLLRQAAYGFTAAQSAASNASSSSPVSSDQNEFDGTHPDDQLSAFVDHLTRSVPRPNRREVSDFYRQSQQLFLTPECAHASHIIKCVDEHVAEEDARAAMETAEAALRSGRPFAEVAEEFSDSPAAGGALGWFPRGQMPAEFDAVVFGLKPAQLSSLFRSRLGFHLVQLHHRRAAGVLPLREVYSIAEELIMKRRRDERVERFLKDVRAKSDIRRVPSAKPNTS